MEIMDDDQEVELLVQSNEMSRIRVGQYYQVSQAKKSKPYTVELTSLGGRVDPENQTIKMYGRIAETAAKAVSQTESVVAFVD
jgi:hypothetical protein